MHDLTTMMFDASQYQLVPKVPFVGMQDGAEALFLNMPVDPSDHHSRAALVKAIWTFMLAAAPTPAALSVRQETVAWRDLLAAVLRETGHEYNYPWDGIENAPGHAHGVPGIWDSDNGEKSGTQCAWCMTWNKARESLNAAPVAAETRDSMPVGRVQVDGGSITFIPDADAWRLGDEYEVFPNPPPPNDINAELVCVLIEVLDKVPLTDSTRDATPTAAKARAVLAKAQAMMQGGSVNGAKRESDDSHLRTIMERDAWRNAMVGLCNGRDWPTTPDEAADHLRKRLHPERAADAQQVGDLAAIQAAGFQDIDALLSAYKRCADHVRQQSIETAQAALMSPAKASGDERNAFDVSDSMSRIPTVARLYYTGLGSRRHRRASTQPGPGEALVFRSSVEYELNRLGARAALLTSGGEDKRDAERYRGLVEHFANEDDAGWLRIVFETSRQGKDHPPEGRKQWFDADIDGELAAIAANHARKGG